MIRWAVLLLTIIFCGPSGAADFHQKPGGDWKALQTAIAKGEIGGGDTVVLMQGEHGILSLIGLHFTPPLTFRGAKGAHVQAIAVKNSSGLVVRDLEVWPTGALNQNAIVAASRDTRGIVLSGLDIRGRADAPRNYLTYTLPQWRTLGGLGGVRLEGVFNSILDSQITATGFAITALGTNARIERNHILGFTGDGMRALADGAIVRGNTVENCIKIDDNHDDGFQAWAPRNGSGPLRGLRIEGNRIFEWRGPAAHPLRCRLQGVGLFDGPYQDLAVINNLVVVTGFHGISLYGGQDSRIINNTVLHPGAAAQNFPWIMLQDQKGGQAARGNVIANNLAARFSITTTPPQTLPEGTNVTITDPTAFFRAPLRGDYRLRLSLRQTTAGLAALAPAHDIDGAPRPQGAGVDLGAFETN
jgi:hypothetical protein